MEMKNMDDKNMNNINTETTDMKVNPLPSITWHWLGMNDSDLNIAIPRDFITFTPGGDMSALRWINGVELGAYKAMGRADAAFSWPGWNDMETGMGPEFDQALSGAKTAFLDIPKGYSAAGPAVITVTAPNGKAAGKLLINAGAGSEASVVIDVRDNTNSKDTCDITDTCDVTDTCDISDTIDISNICNISDTCGTEYRSDILALQLLLHLEPGAHLKLFMVQSLSKQAISCIDIGGVYESGAQAELDQVSLGAEKAYIGICMKLEGDKSSFSGDMGYRVKSGQDVDINYVARHVGRESLSRLNAWGVLEEGARKLFRGTIDFYIGCAGSKGAEKEDVLLLGEHQINQTIPLILCHEEDVEGDHGATISRLGEDVLFYLATRGIDAGTAEEMIAQARLEALISRIPDEDVRRLADKIAAPDKALADPV